MSQESRRKVKDVVLKIGDKYKTIRGLTEHTTCGDVIKMVLRKMDGNAQNKHSYAIFECGNGSERMLSDKTKVLKTIRSWGSGHSYNFCLKVAHRSSEIFKAKKNEIKVNDTSVNNLNKTRDIKNAIQLAQFVKSQKNRLQRHQSDNHVTEICHDNGETSINDFIAQVDQTKMAGFLEFCGAVSANELDRLSGLSDSSKANEYACEDGFVTGKVVYSADKINNVKYATKKVLKPKRVHVTHGQTSTKMARKHTFVDCERVHEKVPTHSTPTRSSARRNLKRHESLAESITSKIARVNQREGKDVILQKYFSDYLSYNSPNRKPFPIPKRERGDGAELNLSRGNPDKGDGSFSTGTPIDNRVTARARRHSDSDSGHEDHEQCEFLDNAFVCQEEAERKYSNYSYTYIKPLPRKLVNDGVTIATQIDKLVDYSFSDASDLETDENSVDILERNVFDEDDEMASFMDSKLHDDFSDEGLSSLGSDDDREILV